MSEKQISDKQGTNQPSEAEALDIQTEIEKIKQPPAIDDAIKQLSPEERRGNQAVAPEMIQEPNDLRDDLQR